MRPGPCAASRRSRTSRACASASGEPRVPMRMVDACKGRSSDARRCWTPLRPFMPPSGRWCKRRPMDATQDKRETLVLGIETSCDETAAAVVARAADGSGRILSNVVRAQWEQHRRYGGVVPEIAARAHVECLDEIVAEAMREAGLGLRRARRRGGDGRAGADRRPAGRRCHRQGHRARAQAAPRRRQSSGGACAHRRPDRRLAAALSAAAGLRRPHPAPDRARRRPLPAARHHHRRCAGRGLRQDGQAAGPRLSRRAGGGAGGRAQAGRTASPCRGRCSAAPSRISPSPA